VPREFFQNEDAAALLPNVSIYLTTALGVAMSVIAVVNALLMAWLWQFPMVPDPGGRDPHGVSTAPRSWTNVHRALGYIFVLIYVVMLWEMVPRMWEFRVPSVVTVVHGALGGIVGLLLVVKIAIIRWFQRFGGKLPWIGGSLAVTAVVMNAVALVPIWVLLRPLTPMTPELAAGRDAVVANCFQCHGASIIISEREDPEKWDRETRKMQRFSNRFAGKRPISEPERALAAAYLATFLAERDDDNDHDDDEADEVRDRGDERDGGGGQRRRRRGRDR
jgi:mono/diheme cytochrome c family protein